MRGATIKYKIDVLDELFQSTLPMRGATGIKESVTIDLSISIHTPHAGSDSKKTQIYI